MSFEPTRPYMSLNQTRHLKTCIQEHAGTGDAKGVARNVCMCVCVFKKLARHVSWLSRNHFVLLWCNLAGKGVCEECT